MNKNFKNFLIYNWGYYLVSAVILLAIWMLILQNLNAFKSYEELSIFIGAKEVSVEKIEKYLDTEILDNKIKNIKVDYSYDHGNNFGYIFTTRGLVNTDVIIVRGSYVKKDDLSKFFLPINGEIIEENINFQPNYLSNNKINYGILVYSEEKNIKIMDDLITYNDKDHEEEYYLFFNNKSTNLGPLSKNSLSDIAFKAMISIINYQGVDNEK